MADNVRRDEPTDVDVGSKDFRFGVTGVGLMVSAAVLMGIIFGSG